MTIWRNLFENTYLKQSFTTATRKNLTIFTTINSFRNKPWFLRVCSTSPLKTLQVKEKFLILSNSSFSHSVFYPFAELPAIFMKFEIVVCKLFQFGRVYRLQMLSISTSLKFCKFVSR